MILYQKIIYLNNLTQI